MISIDKDTNPRGEEGKGGGEDGEDEEGFEEEVRGRGRERTNVSTRVLKNAKTSRCSYFSIPFGCRERDRDTIVPDNPYKLARSLLIKFIELIRDLRRDNCSLSA